MRRSGETRRRPALRFATAAAMAATALAGGACAQSPAERDINISVDSLGFPSSPPEAVTKKLGAIVTIHYGTISLTGFRTSPHTVETAGHGWPYGDCKGTVVDADASSKGGPSRNRVTSLADQRPVGTQGTNGMDVAHLTVVGNASYNALPIIRPATDGLTVGEQVYILTNEPADPGMPLRDPVDADYAKTAVVDAIYVGRSSGDPNLGILITPHFDDGSPNWPNDESLVAGGSGSAVVTATGGSVGVATGAYTDRNDPSEFPLLFDSESAASATGLNILADGAIIDDFNIVTFVLPSPQNTNFSNVVATRC